MALFDALYGHNCRSPLCYDEIGEQSIFGPELITQVTKQVKIIKEHMKVAVDKPKKKEDQHRKQLEFKVRDNIFIKISLIKGMIRFRRKESSV